jgi:hypothetical protein
MKNKSYKKKSKKQESSKKCNKLNKCKIVTLNNGRNKSGGFVYNLDHLPGSRSGDNSFDAFYFFLNNLGSARILTNSSIGGITLLLTLRTGVLSPYRHTRRELSSQPMNSILIKLSLRTDTQPTFSINIDNARNPPSRPGDIIYPFEVNPLDVISREAQIQNDIYRALFIGERLPNMPPVSNRDEPNYINQNIYDPFVPAILGFIPQAENEIDNIMSLIEPVFEGRGRFTVGEDLFILNEFINARTSMLGLGLSIILMEFMDGFTTYANILQSEPDNNRRLDISNKYNPFIIYELTKLLKMGYLHCDMHMNNCMINENSLYFTNNPRDNNLRGRIMIIDFGRILPIPDINNLLVGSLLNDVISTLYIYYNEELLRNMYGKPNYWFVGMPFMNDFIRIRQDITQNYNILTNYLNSYNIRNGMTQSDLLIRYYNQFTDIRFRFSKDYKAFIRASPAQFTKYSTDLENYVINTVPGGGNRRNRNTKKYKNKSKTKNKSKK